MKGPLVRIAVILLLVILIIPTLSCRPVRTTAVWTDTSSLPNAPFGEMAAKGVTVAATYKYIRFHGTASFPDGTVLLSQLYEDQKPLPWWPVDQSIVVKNGTWEIKVPLGTHGAPRDLLSGPFYRFIVYRPLIKAAMGFDLVGPPP